MKISHNPCFNGKLIPTAKTGKSLGITGFGAGIITWFFEGRKDRSLLSVRRRWNFEYSCKNPHVSKQVNSLKPQGFAGFLTQKSIFREIRNFVVFSAFKLFRWFLKVIIAVLAEKSKIFFNFPFLFYPAYVIIK